MKIKLEKEDYESQYQGGVLSKAVKYALPYYKSRAGKYFHRLRSSGQHWLRRNNTYSHTSLSFWCGGGGVLHRGQMYKELPEDAILCAICEGKAIGAGLDGVRKINGREVMYSPRKL